MLRVSPTSHSVVRPSIADSGDGRGRTTDVICDGYGPQNNPPGAYRQKATLRRKLHDHLLEYRAGYHSHVTYRGFASIEKSAPLMADNLRQGFHRANEILGNALQALTESASYRETIEGYLGCSAESTVDTLRRKFLEMERGLEFYANNPQKIVAVGGEDKPNISYNGCVLEPKEKTNLYLNIQSVLDRDTEVTASLILHEVSHAYAKTSDHYYIKSEADYMWASMSKSKQLNPLLLRQAQATAPTEIDKEARAIVEGKATNKAPTCSAYYGMSSADSKAYVRMRRLQLEPARRREAALSNADTLAYLACALNRARPNHRVASGLSTPTPPPADS